LRVENPETGIVKKIMTVDLKGTVGPRPSFEEILVKNDHFLDFDVVIEGGVPMRS
jgi:hypothetical protein